MTISRNLSKLAEGVDSSGVLAPAKGGTGLTEFTPFAYPGVGLAVSTGSAWGTSKTAPTGAVVGTTDAQTLTNKTIDGNLNTITNVLPPDIKTPINVSPASGATGILGTPALTGSTYYSFYGISMAAGQWQVSTVSDFSSTVVNTGDVAGTSVSYSVPSGILSTTTTYYWRVRYKNTDGVYSSWSTPTAFTTASEFAPTVIGQAFGGGYYAGKINQGGTQYYLIVAPKASGQAYKQWKTSQTSTPNTTSVIDGPANSNAMNNASHPAAQFCKGLTIGGYTDWYMPALNELEVCYYFLKPTTEANAPGWGANANAVSPEPISTGYTTSNPAQTSATIFRLGGSESFGDVEVWCSTEQIATHAYLPYFGNGIQGNFGKTGTFYVRAVRRVPV